MNRLNNELCVMPVVSKFGKAARPTPCNAPASIGVMVKQGDEEFAVKICLLHSAENATIRLIQSWKQRKLEKEFIGKNFQLRIDLRKDYLNAVWTPKTINNNLLLCDVQTEEETNISIPYNIERFREDFVRTPAGMELFTQDDSILKDEMRILTKP